MEHAIHRVKSFEVTGPYTLRVTFGDGTQRSIDFQLSWVARYLARFVT